MPENRARQGWERQQKAYAALHWPTRGACEDDSRRYFAQALQTPVPAPLPYRACSIDDVRPFRAVPMPLAIPYANVPGGLRDAHTRWFLVLHSPWSVSF